jgi:putative peptidoglycan lipid II flippase
MMTVIFIVRYDAIRIALQRGAFDADATFMVSEILFIVTLSLLPYVFRDSVTRLFYAFGDSKTPFAVATCSILLKVVLNLIFVKRFGIYGIAGSTACITLFNAVLLGILINRKVKVDYKSIFKTLLKILVASALAWFAGDIVNYAFAKYVPWNFVLGIVKIGSVCVASLIVYVMSAYVLRIECLQNLIARFKKS